MLVKVLSFLLLSSVAVADYAADVQKRERNLLRGKSAKGVTFLILGDWGLANLTTAQSQSGIGYQQELIAATMGKYAQAHPQQFLIALGDNFYFVSTYENLESAD